MGDFYYTMEINPFDKNYEFSTIRATSTEAKEGIIHRQSLILVAFKIFLETQGGYYAEIDPKNSKFIVHLLESS